MKRAFITGFVIWLLATITLRLTGQWIFASKLALFVISAPLMFAVPRLLFSRASIDPAHAAIALVTPGMLLDTISAIWFAQVFPNIPHEAAGLFGGWLLFCNVVALVSALTMRARATFAGYSAGSVPSDPE